MTPTRRTILASMVLAAPAIRARARGGSVVIVGAGAAGLAAASTLRAAGQSFTLVEARDRIGGRAFTDRTLGPDCPFDAGAEYIHWAERNPWAPIARASAAPIAREERVGAPTRHRRQGRQRGRDGGRRAGFSGLDALLVPKGGDTSLADARPSRRPGRGPGCGGPEPAVARRGSRAGARRSITIASGPAPILGRRLRRSGGAAFRGSAGEPRLSGAGDRLVGRQVRVETRRGPLAAAAVIVTVPVGVLRAGTLTFTPALPDPTRTALDGLRMGAYTKSACASIPRGSTRRRWATRSRWPPAARRSTSR